jgi:hypothetical protein
MNNLRRPQHDTGKQCPDDYAAEVPLLSCTRNTRHKGAQKGHLIFFVIFVPLCG